MSMNGWMAQFRKGQKRSARISRRDTAIDIGKGRPGVSKVQWKGLDKVLENLNREASKIALTSVKNLLTAGLLVKGKALKIIPVELGNLKGSAYVIWGGGGSEIKLANPEGSEGTFSASPKVETKLETQHGRVINREKKPTSVLNPFATIGFTAFYAIFVHEDLTASHGKKARLTTPGKKTGSLSDPRRITRTGAVNVQIGQAKFLEQPFLENKAQILSILKGGIQK